MSKNNTAAGHPCEIDIVSGGHSEEPLDDPQALTLDTTRGQFQRGKDLQGLPWQNPGGRAHFQAHQLQRYELYVNVLDLSRYDSVASIHRTEIGSELTKQKKASFYDFYRNFTCTRSSWGHFQLRNLLWTTSSHDVYTMHKNCINHWNMATGISHTVVDCSGGSARNATSSPITVTTSHVKGDLVAVGGLGGQLILASHSRIRAGGTISQEYRIAKSANCITNGIELCENSSGAMTVLVSNNDERVRSLDAAEMRIITSIDLPWAANYASANPLRRHMIAVVGDNTDAVLHDMSTKKPIASLSGHLDYSFAAAWHPAGTLLATGNQDATTRIWDIRRTEKALAILPGTAGSIQSCRYSEDGKWLLCAEPSDFVHIYNVRSAYEEVQTIDYLGDMSGVSFTPDNQSMFVGIVHPEFSSLLCYQRPDVWLDDVLD